MPTLVDIGRACKSGHTGKWKLTSQNRYVCHDCMNASLHKHRAIKRSSTPRLDELILEHDNLTKRLVVLNNLIAKELEKR